LVDISVPIALFRIWQGKTALKNAWSPSHGLAISQLYANVAENHKAPAERKFAMIALQLSSALARKPPTPYRAPVDKAGNTAGQRD
jgi:hypothetical protein